MEVPVTTEPSENDAQTQPVNTAAPTAAPTEAPAPTAPEEQGPPVPAMDLLPPDAESEAESAPKGAPSPEIQAQADKFATKDAERAAKAAHAKKPRAPGVAVAITATVIIALSMAAFIVYAYLKTAK